ncbi:N-acetylmuramoyl-L-alanine amidase [Kineosporia sp. J2-2]|uniref:N-acetylmuramoyl-L-alanine amidase n=1 Tax=Kineosporia corallincola TaxID=2835133 RepID=A0ABS5TJM7_9ACTN|nr:N-acetylmuramoyl-L-alanine amidase [Kineosporia corallincola]MBT0771276.1 N-acetylmuramoyl-L-alanine amidase [Kineosporia corallincola]
MPSASDLPTSMLMGRSGAGRPLHLGDTDELVPVLRALLIRAGVLAPGQPSAEESRFDKVLDSAVRAFQQDRGLVADGVVGPQTALALDGARWHLGDRTLLLTAGHWMRGDDVAALQERMVVLGLHAGPVDGIFGPATESSLRELQRGLGLPPDGICGRPTFTALGSLGRSVSGGDAWALRSRGSVAMAGVSLAGKTVVLDPGSDRTPGALGVTEADVTYDVALRLAERLTAVGARVRLSHRPDEDISTEDRVALAESEGADLVISLITERHANPVASGVATFYWGGGRVGQHSEVGQRLAVLLQREIVARTGLLDDRSHPCSYDPVRLTRMPAVILALGYLTNTGDAEHLGDADFRALIAESMLFAVQRLYLAENDAETGTLKLSDVQAFARQR